MIGRSFFLLSLLQAVMSGEWSADNPRAVTAQNGLCARIPCHYRYPSILNNDPRTGIWFNSESHKGPLAFHSGDHSLESTKFQHRTRLSGILKDNDCSLVIDNVTQQDAGPYFFRVEFGGVNLCNYHPVTQLSVADFTDKPTIFPAELVAGKPVNMTCSFSTTCNGTAPALTWVTHADEPPSASHSVTQQGDTLTYTSVLSLTPALKHHGQNLTCRVTYPTVSSEQTLTLTVEYKSFSIWKAVLLTAGIILMAVLAGFIIYKYILRREDASGNQDTNVIYCPHSATNQSAGSGENGPAPVELKGGGESGEGEEQAVVYANLREVLSSGDTGHSDEGLEYAELWFHSKQGKG
ncbi:myeloid cell surface antigen CD33-like [Amblyraja radiata]|uniref:myeloid cell surface antigen CD33-like n=1 Tax=Amblyraja radiata TaxID=386614 RepID=UPI001402702D|nr:myeloid cell surface antigen CD33-like [Amblyraja radiata]